MTHERDSSNPKKLLNRKEAVMDGLGYLVLLEDRDLLFS